MRIFILLLFSLFILVESPAKYQETSISIEEVIEIINKCEYNKHTFSTEVILSIIKNESNFIILSVGQKGEYGLMQLTDKVYKYYNVDKKYYFEPFTNICTGIRLLEDIYSKVNDKYLTIKIYNSGYNTKVNNDKYMHRFLYWYFKYKENA